jgi:hypothetical protein
VFHHAGALFGQDWFLPAGAPVGAYLLGVTACTIGGFAWMGVMLGMEGVIMGFADGPGKSRYVAASSVIFGLGGALGALSGGIVAQSLAWMQETPLVIGPLAYNNWHVTFAMSFAARVLAVLLAWRLADPGSATAWTVVKELRFNAYNALASWLLSPFRLFVLRGRRGPGRGDSDEA